MEPQKVVTVAAAVAAVAVLGLQDLGVVRDKIILMVVKQEKVEEVHGI